MNYYEKSRCCNADIIELQCQACGGEICTTCENTGRVERGQFDDFTEVNCPDCSDPDDMSGATEGDR